MASESVLGAIAEIEMGQSPPGPTCSIFQRGIPLLNGPTEFGAHHPHPVQFTTDPRKFAEPGDLLFCVRGSTTGRMNWADQRYAIGRGIAALRGKGGYPTSYVRAVVEGNLPRLLAQATGSTFPNVSRKALAELKIVSLGALDAQAIGKLAESIEGRIYLLRQASITLENITQALFKSWFVDFDPVRAKAEGRAPEEMDAATAALFPADFEGSELGDIPKGWRVASLQEHITAERGLSYKGTGLAEDGVPMHNLNSVLEGGGYKYSGIKYYRGDYKDRHIAQPGDIIVANTEQGHHHRLIGFPAVVPRSFETGIYSHHLYRVRIQEHSGLTPEWLYQCLMGSAVRDQIIGCANGSTVNMLKPAGLQIPRFAVPSGELCAAFDAIANPIREIAEANVARIGNLSALRDTLLPRLISGKLRLPDAEVEIEAAFT